MKPQNTIILVIIIAIVAAVGYWFLADDTNEPTPAPEASSTQAAPTLDLRAGTDLEASSTPGL